jgi:putative restriction endonuclease
VADADEGEPVVTNGLALCKLHHAAFDRYFVGIRPDYVVQVRRDLLDEKDGPTLVHGIQALHGTRISLPKRLTQQPDRPSLEVRYEAFKRA